MFHILDSLPTANSAASEAEQLQHLFLKYLDQEPFKKGRIAVNIAQVPHHASLLSINSSKYPRYQLNPTSMTVHVM